MTDIEIAKNTKLDDILLIAKRAGIQEDELELYGKYKAKIDLSILKRLETKGNGKLILVTAVNPTPMGEGKTTVSVGITQALNKIGQNSIVALREPSMGPVFGLKGGATGGGYSQVLPMEDINLHFTGDMHAITSAVNLISACIENHIYHGNELNIDPENIYFKRALDVNDRSLREIEVAMGASINGTAHPSKFQITVASEIMAILCLSNDLMELKKKVSEIIIGTNKNNDFVKVKDLNIEGAVAVILKDAIKPNLVQTTENTPAIIHGGPFANIAHGCNSILATKIALKLSDYVVTEAGFGADLGAEKFFDIKCRQGSITPNLTVIVATVKALKYNGYGNLQEGLSNLGAHIDNIKKFNVPIVVAINRYTDDTDEDVALIKEYAIKKNVIAEDITIWANGGDGAINLANTLVEMLDDKELNSAELESSDIVGFDYLYPLDMHLKDKIEILAKKIYNASDVNFSDKALEKLAFFEEKGYKKLMICVAKTPVSISDNKDLLGAPKNYTFNVRDVELKAGAAFVVVFSGNVIDMPGLPKIPAATKIDIDKNNEIVGIF